MTDQLVLIHAEPEPDWRLDPVTCERGRREVARARRIIHQARSRAASDGAADPLASAA